MRISVNDVYKVGCLIFEMKDVTFTQVGANAGIARLKAQEIVMRLYQKGVVTLHYCMKNKEPIPYHLVDPTLVNGLRRKYRPKLVVEPAFKDQKEYEERLDNAL
jgi:hypothetical protein